MAAPMPLKIRMAMSIALSRALRTAVSTLFGGDGGGLYIYIAALGDNGGLTRTHALNIDSPAVDAGECFDIDGSPVLFDQRGVDRNDGFCDIGLYER